MAAIVETTPAPAPAPAAVVADAAAAPVAVPASTTAFQSASLYVGDLHNEVTEVC